MQRSIYKKSSKERQQKFSHLSSSFFVRISIVVGGNSEFNSQQHAQHRSESPLINKLQSHSLSLRQFIFGGSTRCGQEVSSLLFCTHNVQWARVNEAAASPINHHMRSPESLLFCLLSTSTVLCTRWEIQIAHTTRRRSMLSSCSPRLPSNSRKELSINIYKSAQPRETKSDTVCCWWYHNECEYSLIN